MLNKEQIRDLRNEWDYLFKVEDITSLSGRTWKTLLSQFKEYQNPIETTPLSAQNHKELSDLKRISNEIKRHIVDFKKRILELRKQDKLLSEISDKIKSEGVFSDKEIQITQEMSIKYDIIFETHRPIIEYIESLESFNLENLVKEAEQDFRMLAQRTKTNFESEV